MKLAIFDIDGTLLDTNRVDWACYARALELHFGQTDVNTNWQDYRYTTDSGIFQEFFQKTFFRRPEPEEVNIFKDRFLELLQESYRTQPQSFSQIPGAGIILDRLTQIEDWGIGFATGGWRASAVLKLESAGIPIHEEVLSTADDAPAREDIIANCILKAKAYYGRDGFAKIVSVGDGIWDVRAAVAMDISFIGIGDKALLTAMGAQHVIRDYQDVDIFLRLLDDSRPPKQPI